MIRISVIAAILISFVSTVVGQAIDIESAHVSRSERAIRNLERIYAEAVVRQDIKTVGRILADDFVATSSRGELRNKAQETDDIKPALKPDPDFAMEAFDLDHVNVRMFGDMAIVTGRSTLKVCYTGQSSTAMFRYTHVYARRKHRWAAVSQQLTRIPSQEAKTNSAQF
jgi:ketosteroid isomerase-like protein